MRVPMITHFARVDFRNDNRVFGIKAEDRFSHLYIIGKTGTGKSNGRIEKHDDCVMFNRPLDTLLMHHVSFGVIWIVTKRPSELLSLNQKHVRGCASVVPRVPDAAITVLLELVVAKLKEPFVRASSYARIEVALNLGD